MQALAPDVVVVATGAVPSDPMGVPSVWDALSGQVRVEGDVTIYDGVGEHAALSLADKLVAEGARITLITPDRMAGRGLGGQNAPVYLRNLARAGAAILTDRALTGVERRGNALTLRLRLRHAFSREEEVLEAATLIADFGAEPAPGPWDDLLPRARNRGEIDPEAIALLRSQPEPWEGDYLLLRAGDALAPRDIHAAMFEAHRLARVI